MEWRAGGDRAVLVGGSPAVPRGAGHRPAPHCARTYPGSSTPMLTGQQYLDSLKDGRKTYFEGDRIDDLPAHPILGQTAAFTAKAYDKWYDPTPGATSPLLGVPRSAEDLRALIPMLHDAGMMAHVTSTSIQTLKTAAGRMTDVKPEYIDRISSYIDEAQRSDIRITQCITDAKGDRSKPPGKQEDPDAYVRVVKRTSEGVVIRGAKLHITAASLGHELMTIPTKRMKPGEEDYAIGCMVPCNAPGVKFVDVDYAVRHRDDRRPYRHPGRAGRLRRRRMYLRRARGLQPLRSHGRRAVQPCPCDARSPSGGRARRTIVGKLWAP